MGKVVWALLLSLALAGIRWFVHGFRADKLSRFCRDCTLHIFSSSVLTELAGWFEPNLTTLKYIVPAKFLQGSQKQSAIGGIYMWGSDLQKPWILSAERKRKSDNSHEYKTWSQVSYRPVSLGCFNRPILRFSIPSPDYPALLSFQLPSRIMFWQ